MNTVDLEKKIGFLQKENETLLELQKTKETLSNMIIHDLKGPLGEVISNLDILTYSKTLNEMDKEVLETAIQSCNNLLAMIMNLLDIGKMENGKMRLCPVLLSIQNLILKKTGELKVIANQKNLKFKFHFRDDTPDIKADSEILTRLISNLLNNAIAYSRPGSVISITALKEESFLKVKIKDTGKGIPKQFQAMLFDKYQQVNEGVRRHGSTGLGLTFCKMAVEAHGGTIGVFSEEEKGSEFFFSIPVNT